MTKLESELQGLREAIAIESDGSEFYGLAAEKADDEGSKAAFLFLAKEELKHRRWLERMYRNISEQLSVEWIESLDEVEPPEIFDWKACFSEQGSIPVSVFRIGMLMEKNSIEHYQKMAAEAEQPPLKGFYTKMVQWETEHLLELDRLYEMGKDEWWESQGYSPA